MFFFINLILYEILVFITYLKYCYLKGKTTYEKNSIFCIRDSLDNPTEYFHKTHKNSLLIFDDDLNKFLFKSKFSDAEEIFVTFEFIIFHDLLLETLTSIIEAIRINNETVELKNTTKNRIIGIINNAILIYHNNYINIPNKTIFDFIGQIFINLLRRHTFANRNKRFFLI